MFLVHEGRGGGRAELRSRSCGFRHSSPGWGTRSALILLQVRVCSSGWLQMHGTLGCIVHGLASLGVCVRGSDLTSIYVAGLCAVVLHGIIGLWYCCNSGLCFEGGVGCAM